MLAAKGYFALLNNINTLTVWNDTKKLKLYKTQIQIQLEHVAIIAMYCHLRPPDTITFQT